MTETKLLKCVQWSPVFHVCVLTFGTGVSFLIAVFKGDVNLYLPFISETGAYSPEMCIFSLFLTFGSFIGCIVVYTRFLFLSQFDGSEMFHRINVTSALIGSFAMMGLTGVAAFPMTTVFWAHLLSASIYFVGSALYFICATFVTFKMEGKSNIFKFRSVLTAVLLILLFILMICFPVALKNWHKCNSIIPALKEPQNEGFTMILICSILEWSIVAIIVTFTLSFIKEMKNHGILLTVTSIKRESDTVVQDFPTVEETTSSHADQTT